MWRFLAGLVHPPSKILWWFNFFRKSGPPSVSKLPNSKQLERGWNCFIGCIKMVSTGIRHTKKSHLPEVSFCMTVVALKLTSAICVLLVVQEKKNFIHPSITIVFEMTGNVPRRLHNVMTKWSLENAMKSVVPPQKKKKENLAASVSSICSAFSRFYFVASFFFRLWFLLSIGQFPASIYSASYPINCQPRTIL